METIGCSWYGRYCRYITFFISNICQIAVLPSCTLFVFIGGIWAELFCCNIRIYHLCQLAMIFISDGRSHLHQFFRFVGDDIDHTGNGVRAIEWRTGTIQHFDAFHTAHINAWEVDIIRCISGQFTSVDQNQHIFIGESVHHQVRSHWVGRERKRRNQHGHCLLKVCDAGFLYFIGGYYFHRCRCVFEPLVCTGTCYNYRIQVNTHLCLLACRVLLCKCTHCRASSHEDGQ